MSQDIAGQIGQDGTDERLIVEERRYRDDGNRSIVHLAVQSGTPDKNVPPFLAEVSWTFMVNQRQANVQEKIPIYAETIEEAFAIHERQEKQWKENAAQKLTKKMRQEQQKIVAPSR